MSTSNAEAPRSLVNAVQRLLTKQRKVTEELARRAEAIERKAPHARHRTWRATKNEILGRLV